MRKLVGGLAKFSTPLIATALLVGCQQDPRGQGVTQETDAVPEAELQQKDVSPNYGEQGQVDVDAVLSLCGWECKAWGDGDVNISGQKSLDAFFAASGTLEAKALSLQAEVKADLGSLAAALGVEGTAGMSIDQLTAAIDTQVGGGLGGTLVDGITIEMVPPKCEVSASASLEAAAKCDATVDPGMATVECSGSCEASASAMLECSGSAQLSCKGTAPSFACEGTCTGSCELEASAKCEGTCEGTCEVDGSVACNGTCEMDGTAACDGTCEGDTDAGGNCTGACTLRAGAMCTGSCKLNAGASCEGSCKGSCELKAGGNCQGECKGECEYTPPSGECEGGATAKCEGSAEASVECSGKCSGEVTPPMVSAECEATAKAEADFAAECHPPSVELKYNLSANVQAEFAADASAKAAFEGQMQAVGKAFANLAARGAKIEGVLRAGGGLITAAGSAVTSAAGDIGGSGDVRAIVGGYCAIEALPAVTAALQGAVGNLQLTGTAVLEVATTFGAS
jgi:hypothetical protein